MDAMILWVSQGVMTLLLGALSWFVRGAIEEGKASEKRITRIETDQARHVAELRGKMDVIEERFNGYHKLSDEVSELRKEFRGDMKEIRDAITGLRVERRAAELGRPG